MGKRVPEVHLVGRQSSVEGVQPDRRRRRLCVSGPFL